jgi:rhodanese-related sulfurtransferase
MIVVLTALMFIAYDADAANGKTSTSQKSAIVQKHGYVKITVWESYKALKSGKAVFMDARKQEDFYSGHIPGALSVPPEMVMQTKDKKFMEQHIITYCYNKNCEMADDLAKDLIKLGFKNVSVMTDGWEGWFQSGYPVQSGR